MLPPNFDDARMLPLGQHPADEGDNFLTIAAFRVAITTNKSVAPWRIAEQIVNRRMVHDQLAWRASQHPKQTTGFSIFQR